MDQLDQYSDPIDQGSQMAEAERASLEVAQREKAKPKQVRNEDGTWPEPDCVECGEPIGDKRLEAIGANTCITCATLNEQRQRLMKRN